MRSIFILRACVFVTLFAPGVVVAGLRRRRRDGAIAYPEGDSLIDAHARAGRYEYATSSTTTSTWPTTSCNGTTCPGPHASVHPLQPSTQPGYETVPPYAVETDSPSYSDFPPGDYQPPAAATSGRGPIYPNNSKSPYKYGHPRPSTSSGDYGPPGYMYSESSTPTASSCSTCNMTATSTETALSSSASTSSGGAVSSINPISPPATSCSTCNLTTSTSSGGSASAVNPMTPPSASCSTCNASTSSEVSISPSTSAPSGGSASAVNPMTPPSASCSTCNLTTPTSSGGSASAVNPMTPPSASCSTCNLTSPTSSGGSVSAVNPMTPPSASCPTCNSTTSATTASPLPTTTSVCGGPGCQPYGSVVSSSSPGGSVTRVNPMTPPSGACSGWPSCLGSSTTLSNTTCGGPSCQQSPTASPTFPNTTTTCSKSDTGVRSAGPGFPSPTSSSTYGIPGYVVSTPPSPVYGYPPVEVSTSKSPCPINGASSNSTSAGSGLSTESALASLGEPESREASSGTLSFSESSSPSPSPLPVAGSGIVARAVEPALEPEIESRSVPHHAALVSCKPELYLPDNSPVSESKFGPVDMPITVFITCEGEHVIGTYAVFINGAAQTNTLATGNSITFPGLGEGYQQVRVLAATQGGQLISKMWEFMAGDGQLVIVVHDEAGNPVSGALVEGKVPGYHAIEVTGMTDKNGEVVFENMPPATLSLTATNEGNSIAMGSVAGGATAKLTLTMDSFAPTSPNYKIESASEPKGWSGDGQLVHSNSRSKPLFQQAPLMSYPRRHLKLEEKELPRGLAVVAHGQMTLQKAQKSYMIDSAPKEAFIEYQFQADEYSDGDFGNSWNGYCSVTIRADDGSSKSVLHGANELGRGASSDARGPNWWTAQLAVPEGATIVNYLVGVASAEDSKFQSEILVRKVGVCNRCASCNECPSLARCQDMCRKPLQNSCFFYRSCVEETMRCGQESYALKTGEVVCNRFQHSAWEISEQARAWFLGSEQCIQSAMVPMVSCTSSCEAMEFAGKAALAGCYARDGLCGLEGMDYVTVLGILDNPWHNRGFMTAIRETSGCLAEILWKIDADIDAMQEKGPRGTANATALYLARQMLEVAENRAHIPADQAVEYVASVESAVAQIQGPTTSLDVLNFLKSSDRIDGEAVDLLRNVPHAHTEFVNRESGVIFVDGSGGLVIRLSALAHAATGALIYDDHRADLAGWAGHLFDLYADWQASKTPSGRAFADHLGTEKSSFTLPVLREDIYGWLWGYRLRGGRAAGSVAEALGKVLFAGAFADVLEAWIVARFHDDGQIEETCREMFGVTAEENEMVWEARTSVAVTRGISSPEEVGQDKLDQFCGGFVKRILGLRDGD